MVLLQFGESCPVAIGALSAVCLLHEARQRPYEASIRGHLQPERAAQQAVHKDAAG